MDLKHTVQLARGTPFSPYAPAVRNNAAAGSANVKNARDSTNHVTRVRTKLEKRQGSKMLTPPSHSI